MTTSFIEEQAVAAPGIEAKVVRISSRTAAQWLALYKGPNRPLSDSKVQQFRSDMENGRWIFDGAPIRFSNENPPRILDGQHRLNALAHTEPELEFEFLVVGGLPREAQMVMDINQVRTVGQNLKLHGVKNASTVAAVTKLYLDWKHGRLFRSSQRSGTTKPEAQQWALENGELLGKLFDTQFLNVDAPASVVGAFGLAVLQIAPVRGYRFLHQLATGVGLKEGDPILALDRRLRNIRRTGVKMSQREYLAYFIKAWNVWVLDGSLQRLQIGHLTEDTFPLLLTVSDEPDTQE